MCICELQVVWTVAIIIYFFRQIQLYLQYSATSIIPSSLGPNKTVRISYILDNRFIHNTYRCIGLGLEPMFTYNRKVRSIEVALYHVLLDKAITYILNPKANDLCDRKYFV